MRDDESANASDLRQNSTPARVRLSLHSHAGEYPAPWNPLLLHLSPTPRHLALSPRRPKSPPTSHRKPPPEIFAKRPPLLPALEPLFSLSHTFKFIAPSLYLSHLLPPASTSTVLYLKLAPHASRLTPRGCVPHTQHRQSEAPRPRSRARAPILTSLKLTPLAANREPAAPIPTLVKLAPPLSFPLYYPIPRPTGFLPSSSGCFLVSVDQNS
ncbi:hypothetical protein Ancab_024609 [Ancistrocladus abbreviatus]